MRRDSGQSLIEFAMVLPLLLVLVFGIIDIGAELLDDHVVTRLSREGSNMISRDTTLQDALTAMKSMTTTPVNFDDGTSKLVLSVFKRVGTVGAANFDKVVLYERVEYGSLPNHSALTTAGAGAFGGAPDYNAVNADNDANLVATNFPANLLVTRGDFVYVTEIYSRHTFITPLQDLLRLAFPTTLYSVACTLSTQGDVMTTQRRGQRTERGFVLVYMAAIILVLLTVSGLAVDAGEAYLVKAQLSKAVDGAALGAARNLNGGDANGEATRIFNANFPGNYLGTTGVSGPSFSLATDAANGINIVTVGASATMPTTFMKVANIPSVTITSSAQATRRMVDLSLVLDVSSSIGSKWPTVRDAIRTFVDSFDQAHDRVALITFGNGATVLDPMPGSRGFNKSSVESDVPNSLPGGSTLMVEGLYRGWDELRSVPSGSQSSLRVIVLFTDGASNGVPGIYDASGSAKSLRTWDFPKSANDPDSQTWNQPHIDGLYDSQSGGQSPSYSLVPTSWNSTQTLAQVPLLPLATTHAHHRSGGIPTSFPLQSSSLMVNGAPQNSRRGLRNKDAPTGRYPADVWNINNAARNVLEMIANSARADNGDYPIRIYTIGMGYLVQDMLGTMPEKPEDILKRVANDRTSADFNSAQLDGKYFYAQTEQDVAPAFENIQNEIIRLSK